MDNGVPLDEAARTILAKVGEPADAICLCVPCLMAATRADRWGVLKAIRRLIHAGAALCLYQRCSACRGLDLVVRRRYPRLASAN